MLKLNVDRYVHAFKLSKQAGDPDNIFRKSDYFHYDQRKQVFRFRSPKNTSAKYWPGVLGLVCTHSVIQAKTFVKGEPIGVQTFIF